MELDFKKNDQVGPKEKQIEQILYMGKKGKPDIKTLAQHIYHNKDIIMLKTLLSMVYKTRSKAIYKKDKIKISAEFEQDTIAISEEIIGTIYKINKKNNYDETRKKIIKNGYIIQEILLKYYAEKNLNYIEEKFFIGTILSQKKQGEILSLNPFMINQILDYQQHPLTPEEQIIIEIIEYYLEAQQHYDEPKDIIYTIKLLMENNKEFNEIERKLAFVLGNVYQESKEKKDYDTYSKISRIIEDPIIKPNNVIKYIKSNPQLLANLIEKFFEYNVDIQEGRLEQLEKIPSAQYVKKIYRKNP